MDDPKDKIVTVRWDLDTRPILTVTIKWNQCFHIIDFKECDSSVASCFMWGGRISYNLNSKNDAVYVPWKTELADGILNNFCCPQNVPLHLKSMNQ